MKTLLLLLCLFGYTSAVAQYNINWAEAPLNEIPIKYKKEHFNLKGPIKTYQFYNTYNFDKEGYLIYGVFGSNFEFTYDINHKLISTSSWLGDAFKPLYLLVLDASGKIIEKKVFNNSEIYQYDANGNWTGTIDQYGTRKENSYIYTYDTKNRVVKAEYWYKEILWEQAYTYTKDGEFVVVSIIYKNYKDASKNSKDVIYYKNGQWYSSVKNDNVKYDRFGNITQGVDKDGKVNMMSNHTYIYYGDPGVSDTFERDLKSSIKPTTAAKDPKCTEGNCINGFGNYKFDDGSYLGFFEDGKRHGFGVYTWNSGKRYTGEWKNGRIDGFGILTLEAGIWQSGNFNDSKLNGLGVKHINNDTLEYGEYSDGKLVTKYNYFPNQNKDKGCVAGDCQNGYGKYIFDNGGIYIGFYKNSFMVQGQWHAPNGNVYKGLFGVKNSYNGFSIYTFANGDIYFGYFRNGQREGRGVINFKATNTYKKGEWKDDVLIKEY